MDKVVHFEVPADDLGRAKKFYQSVFGWKIMDVPHMDYAMVETTETVNNRPKEPGAINGGMFQRNETGRSPVIVIGVASIDATIKKVEGAGGKTVARKVKVGDMGHYARVADSEGNVIGLWE
ncbi:MAG: VOC family protein [Xanthobacteraceae bacterium]